jgi:uncharacterized protein
LPVHYAVCKPAVSFKVFSQNMSDDSAVISRDLKLPLESVTVSIRLIDEGNAIPFIARFRKDQTGGLDADQLMSIKQRTGELRALADRKTFVLKSIESQGKLTEALASEIDKATNSRRVEDLYLPFKAKKQSLALTARQQGLEPLANEIFNGERPDVDLPSRATEFVRVDKGLMGVDDVISGVGHLIAERLSERSDLRRELRKVIWSTGELTCRLLKNEEDAKEDGTSTGEGVSDPAAPLKPEKENKGDKAKSSAKSDVEPTANAVENAEMATEATLDLAAPIADIHSADEADAKSADDAGAQGDSTQPVQTQSVQTQTAETASLPPDSDGAPSSPTVPDSSIAIQGDPSVAEHVAATETPAAEAPDATGTTNDSGITAGVAPTNSESSESLTTGAAAEATPVGPVGNEAPPIVATQALPKKRKKKKKKKSTPHPFADYNDFSESIRKIPHHRVLAINRGERGGQIKVKLKVDFAKVEAVALELLVRPDHPFKSFVEDCARDALSRLVLPSLEREVRRELTDAAERHAVQVFAHNLKGLLLRPPVRGKRILAIDPGYKSGCTVAVFDINGNFQSTDRISIVGNEQRREENRKKLAEFVRKFDVNLIAIGNGTACREAEKLVSDAIAQDLSDLSVKYVIVNEAGASIYSTSEIGKEELPDQPPNVRSAVSIGRRILDPLSELVKIAPGNLGVGLYQHDIKAKHLAESLDEVVESCVNFVGVNTATASPALLAYVAGLNQLTARRLIEHRQEKPITNRQELKEVPGVGEATFVQSAGFLRVFGGTNPFDETAIHPESYPIAEKVLEKISVAPATWLEARRGSVAAHPAAANDETNANALSAEILQKLNSLNPIELAKELSVGELLMRDIIESLIRPTHDPRQDGDAPVFRSGIIKIEDLKPEMELQSQVVNVVDFGVFVDVGLGYSCLVHVSELSAGFIKDLYQQYAVGDPLMTWVKEVDVSRRRVKLTAVKPGTPKQERRPRAPRERSATSSGRPASQNRQNESQTSGQAVGGNQTGERRRPSGEFQNRGGQTTGRPGSNDRRPQRRDKPRPGNQKFNQAKVERRAKPKPVAPITKEMLKGEKPMRSFSDLAQFFTKKKEDGSDE